MADEVAEPEGAPEEKKRGLLVPILVGVVVLLTGIGGGAGLMWYFSDSTPASADGVAAADGVRSGDASIPDLMPSSEVVSLGQFTVNLRDSAGGRLLQMEISVEGKGEAATLAVEREAQLRDAILMLASDYSFLELDGAQGRIRLRDEIQRRINRVLTPAKVDRVYFTSFVIQ